MDKTYAEVAASFEAFEEYVDVNGTLSREAFDALTVEERYALIEECFGPETGA